jgi:hypothetical protein
MERSLKVSSETKHPKATQGNSSQPRHTEKYLTTGQQVLKIEAGTGLLAQQDGA